MATAEIWAERAAGSNRSEQTAPEFCAPIVVEAAGARVLVPTGAVGPTLATVLFDLDGLFEQGLGALLDGFERGSR